MAIKQDQIAADVADLQAQVARLWKQAFGTSPPPLHPTKPSTLCGFQRPPPAATTTDEPALALVQPVSLSNSSNPPSQPKIENQGVFLVSIKKLEPDLFLEGSVAEILSKGHGENLSTITMEKMEMEELQKSTLSENQVAVVEVPKRNHASTSTYAQEVLAKIPMKNETLYGFDPGIETKSQAKVETTVVPKRKIFSDSVLMAATYGEETKLKLAFEKGIRYTHGIDVDAMSINDIDTITGARALFFLDYFLTRSLDVELADTLEKNETLVLEKEMEIEGNHERHKPTLVVSASSTKEYRAKLETTAVGPKLKFFGKPLYLKMYNMSAGHNMYAAGKVTYIVGEAFSYDWKAMMEKSMVLGLSKFYKQTSASRLFVKISQTGTTQGGDSAGTMFAKVGSHLVKASDVSTLRAWKVTEWTIAWVSYQ